MTGGGPLMGIPVDSVIVTSLGLWPLCRSSSPSPTRWVSGGPDRLEGFIAAVVGGIVRSAGLVGGFTGLTEIPATVFPSTYRDLISFGILMGILTLDPLGSSAWPGGPRSRGP
jgi:branched-chain amino acid transport system permease protein